MKFVLLLVFVCIIHSLDFKTLYNVTFTLYQPKEAIEYKKYESFLQQLYYEKADHYQTLKKSFPNENLKKLQKISDFISNIKSNIGYPENFSDPLSCIIIGSGPNGLLSSIQSFKAGCQTKVFEKREFYSRDTWLDIYPQPWSFSFDIVSSLGLENFEFVPQKIGNSELKVITVRTQILELFLYKICRILNIDFHFGHRLIELNNTVVELENHKKERIFHPFNVLIGADGTKSLVRKRLNIGFTQQTNVKYHDKLKIIQNLSQLSFIVNFKNIDGKCPEINPKDPWNIGFYFKNVHSVFKRWYLGYCQLQILFHEDYSNELKRNYGQNWVDMFLYKYKRKLFDFRYPIDLLFAITKELFVNPPKSLFELSMMLKRRNDDDYDFFILNTRIMKADVATKVLSDTSVVFLSGDSSITPHFRLGIGVNNGFVSFHEKEIENVIVKLNKIGKNNLNLLNFDFSDKITKETLRIQKMIDFQVSTIYYEAYCKMVLFFDGFKQIFNIRDFKLQDYIQLYRPNC